MRSLRLRAFSLFDPAARFARLVCPGDSRWMDHPGEWPRWWSPLDWHEQDSGGWCPASIAVLTSADMWSWTHRASWSDVLSCWYSIGDGEYRSARWEAWAAWLAVRPLGAIKTGDEDARLILPSLARVPR
jgi:hypothetical protein